SRPTMCLMQTDLPVPDGPRIIEICPSGMPRFRPLSTVLRPNAFFTSMNSTASVAADSERAVLSVCQRYSSSCSPSGCCGSGSYCTAGGAPCGSCWGGGGGGGGTAPSRDGASAALCSQVGSSSS